MPYSTTRTRRGSRACYVLAFSALILISACTNGSGPATQKRQNLVNEWS